MYKINVSRLDFYQTIEHVQSLHTDKFALTVFQVLALPVVSVFLIAGELFYVILYVFFFLLLLNNLNIYFLEFLKPKIHYQNDEVTCVSVFDLGFNRFDYGMKT